MAYSALGRGRSIAASITPTISSAADAQPEVDHRERHFLPSLPQVAAQAQKTRRQQQPQSAGRVDEEQLERILPGGQIARPG